ncbi:uncharacterized protein LY79DRAFT_511431 [Colletotrichum navitas]|uniref:Uncharacterized protein n=1 Tax=Colletotrichum navitas TaxID=681940 RepID=A0AAD8Q330_9PEZI|nr:uncharacterized protein LY79DRAFT_511431 [Colletotrichum navitas]KAK1595021.1 hypothetical protein LY79DRAFT_511431 [Colletotrichum navitas]
MIEEASHESSSSLSNGSSPNQEMNGPLDFRQTENNHITEYEQMVSNVGPHGTQHMAATNDTADTVLYGNWEQDNNMQELGYASTPDTVVRFGYHAFYGEDDTTETESSSHSVDQGTSAGISKVEVLPTTKDWSIFQSNLVDYGPEEPSPRLPGCSAGHPYTKMWKMSDSAMIAYGAMRGSMMQTNDPLRSWMEVKAYEAAIRELNTDGAAATSSDHSVEQKNLSLLSSPEGKGKSVAVGSHGNSQPESAIREPSSLANEATTSPVHSTGGRREVDGDYIEMLKEANMVAKEYAPAEIDRKSTYDVPRPRFLHISPKFEGFKFEDYLPPHVDIPEPSYKQLFDPNRDFVKEYDVSDDEGDPVSGRISPCTFRLLAEGCVKRDSKANRVYMAHDTQRMRPPTPFDDCQRRLTIDRLALSFELQRDVNDGGWITPCYSVESEPSIIYQPPGVTLKHKMRNWWFGLFDRMDPLAARRFRKVQFREANDPVAPLETATEYSVPSTTSSERNHAYTDTEVLEALHAAGCRRVAGIAPQNAPLIISQRWQTVSRWKGQETELNRENDGMRCAIERAKIELREIRLSVNHLLQKRATEELAIRQRKHKRVLRQVSAHLHELRYEIQSKLDALKCSQTLNESMKTELAMLQLQIKEECSRVDMASPDEVQKAVSQHFRDKMTAVELADCF